MDILEILKQRMTPLYPGLASQFAPMPDTHGQAVAQSQQGQGNGLASLLSQGASLAAGAMGGGEGGFDASRYDDFSKQAPAPSGSELGIGSGRDMSATGPGLGETPPPPPPAAGASPSTGGNQYDQFLANAGPSTYAGAGSGRDTGQPPAPEQAQPVQPEAPALKRILSRSQQIEEEMAGIQGKEYDPPVYRGPAGPNGEPGKTSSKPKEGYVLEKPAGKNYDKSHNIIDVLKGIGLGALQGAAKGGLPGLIGGAAAGGIGAGVNRNFDDKMWDDFKLGGLRNELGQAREDEIGGYKRDKAAADAEEARNKPQREAAKDVAEINDKRMKVAQAALKESLDLEYYDPKDPRHREVVAQSGINPDEMPAFDNRGLVQRQLADKTTITIKGSDAWKEEQENARFDANKTQSMAEFNAKNKLDVQKQNISNEMKHQDNVLGIITKISEANAEAIGGNAEAKSAYQRLEVARQAVEAGANAGDQEAVDKARKEFDGAMADFSKSLGKVEGGAKLAAELKKAMPKRPKTITYEEVRPTTVGVGTYNEKEFTQRAKAKGLTGAKLAAAIEQAKRDGVIR